MPQLCQVCQIPAIFTEHESPSVLSLRQVEYNDERYHFCSDGCADIFNDEPEKYIQAWLPVHQIYQGNCDGSNVSEVVSNYYNMNLGQDNLDYEGSPDQKRWQEIQNNG